MTTTTKTLKTVSYRLWYTMNTPTRVNWLIVNPGEQNIQHSFFSFRHFQNVVELFSDLANELCFWKSCLHLETREIFQIVLASFIPVFWGMKIVKSWDTQRAENSAIFRLKQRERQAAWRHHYFLSTGSPKRIYNSKLFTKENFWGVSKKCLYTL